MSDESVQVQGSPWTSVRYFSTFEEANSLRNSLKTGDLSGTLQIKVKRCGISGSQYVVKTRQSLQMTAAAQSLDEAVETKPTKKTRKTKN